MSDPPLGPEASGSPIIRVGLDASPLRIGHAISVANTIVSAGTFYVDRDAPLKERKAFYTMIRDELRRLEDEHKRDLRTIGIEAPYVGLNRQGSLNHARNIGHAEAFLYNAFPYARLMLVHPASWRRALNISHRGKAEAWAYAEAAWKDTIDDQDTADAICIVKSLPIIEEE